MTFCAEITLIVQHLLFVYLLCKVKEKEKPKNPEDVKKLQELWLKSKKKKRG